MGFGIKSIVKGVKKVGGGMIGGATGALVGGMKGGFKGAVRGAAGGSLPSSFIRNAYANRNAPAEGRAPLAPYKPIPVPNYSQDMQRYYQMTNNSVPAVQRMNPGMIQRGGYQGPTFANDRPQTSLGGGLMQPQMRGGRGVGGMIRRFMPGRSGPRPIMTGNYGRPPSGNITIPRGEFNPSSPNNPRLNMSLDPGAGPTGGMNGGGLMFQGPDRQLNPPGGGMDLYGNQLRSSGPRPMMVR